MRLKYYSTLPDCAGPDIVLDILDDHHMSMCRSPSCYCTMKYIFSGLILSLFPCGFHDAIDATIVVGDETTNSEYGSSKLHILPPTARILSGSYILVLRDDLFAMDALNEIMSSEYVPNGRVQYTYSSAFVGAAVTGVSANSLNRLLESSHVLSITPVRIHLGTRAIVSTCIKRPFF